MTNHTADFYEREYRGGRDRIINYDQYFADWPVWAAETRQTCAYVPDLAYGAGAKETLDLFPAANSTRLLVFIHGGYWHSMDKHDYSWIARSFVAAGISVAVVNYALCPTVTMPTIVDQNRRAIAWLYHHAREHGAGFEKIIVTGHSAGGHLTGMMFATDWAKYGMPAEAIGGGVSLSGLFDLEPLLNLTMNDDYLKMNVPTARELSPIHYAPTVRAPLVVAVGQIESGEFHRQSQMICDAWPNICVGPLDLTDIHHFNILNLFTDLTSAIWQAAPHLLND